jgi:hypothetical protein
MSAISSAVGGFGDSSVFGIKFLLIAGRFPERNQVVKLAFSVLPYLKGERKQAISYPPDRAVL